MVAILVNIDKVASNEFGRSEHLTDFRVNGRASICLCGKVSKCW